MAFAINTQFSRCAARPSVSAPRAPARCVLVASSERDNPYHDRETTKSRKSNPGGTKDANVSRQDKQDQFEYQQERLEWRRKNQTKDATLEGVDRVEPPVTNMAHDMSAERRGPDMEDTGPHGDTLKELVDNVKDTLTGKKHHKEDDK